MVCALAQNFLEVAADFAVDWATESGEGVQCGLREDGEVVFDTWQAGESALLGEDFEIECIVADGDGWAEIGRASCRERVF